MASKAERVGSRAQPQPLELRVSAKPPAGGDHGLGVWIIHQVVDVIVPRGPVVADPAQIRNLRGSPMTPLNRFTGLECVRCRTVRDLRGCSEPCQHPLPMLALACPVFVTRDGLRSAAGQRRGVSDHPVRCDVVGRTRLKDRGPISSAAPDYDLCLMASGQTDDYPLESEPDADNLAVREELGRLRQRQQELDAELAASRHKTIPLGRPARGVYCASP